MIRGLMSQTPVAEVTVERCRPCGDVAEIALHCERCGKAICVECVLDCEQANRRCSMCQLQSTKKVKRRKY